MPFRGMAVADEPNAVLIGRDILIMGGSAVDAAVAMSFSMAVALPSRVGLDGGGFCQLFNPSSKTVETLDFVSDVPAFTRGMFALYARGGKLRWQEVVLPSENLAKFGMTVSRAFAKDLEELYSSNVSETEQIRSYFSDSNGFPLREGSGFSQIELSGVLAAIRAKGAGDFYLGSLADRYSATVNDISKDMLREYVPVWAASQSVKSGNETVFFASNELVGDSWLEIFNSNSHENLNNDFISINDANNKGFASLAVADSNGMAVSCVLGIGDMFGRKKVIDRFGIVEASLERDVFLDSAKSGFFASSLKINQNVNDFRMVISGVGSDVLESAVEIVKTSSPKKQRIPAPDLIDKVLSNNNSDYSRMNVIHCSDGIPPFPDSCSMASDPRGHGLASIAGIPNARKKLGKDIR